MTYFDNRGFSALEALLAVLIVGVIAGAGYFIYQRNDKPEVESSKTSQSSDAESEVTEEADPQDDTDYLVIDRWDVKIPVDESVAGLEYSITSRGVLFSFRTTSLDEATGTCENNENSVHVARGKASDPFPGETGSSPDYTFEDAHEEISTYEGSNYFSFKLGEYYYASHPGAWGASCASNDEEVAEEGQAQKAIGTALKAMVAN